MKDLLQALTPGGTDWRLASQLDPKRLPAHVAIIMDGNGRWARRRSYPRILGHKAGIDVVRKVVEACAQLGLEALTLYAFSVENWKRPRHEIEGLWRLLRFYLRREVPELMRNNVRLVAIGGLQSLPANVQSELQTAMQRTAQNTGMQLNLAINYGGRTEIVDAVNAILNDARQSGSGNIPLITEEMLAGRLYTAGLCDPDLLIRTSGEMRISNFLLWQIAYAEIYVTETLWPDFTVTDLLRALQDFQLRDRRFGGLTAAAQSSSEKDSLGDPLPFDGDSSSVIHSEAAEQPVA
jgi:undecaprenyl diphosphate synthase